MQTNSVMTGFSLTSAEPTTHWQGLDMAYVVQNLAENWLARFNAGENVTGDLDTWLRTVTHIRAEIRFRQRVLAEMLGTEFEYAGRF